MCSNTMQLCYHSQSPFKAVRRLFGVGTGRIWLRVQGGRQFMCDFFLANCADGDSFGLSLSAMWWLPVWLYQEMSTAKRCEGRLPKRTVRPEHPSSKM